MKNNKKGFTLVELLAVIVVLAIVMLVVADRVGDAMLKSRGNSLVLQVKSISREVEKVGALDNQITTEQIKKIVISGDLTYLGYIKAGTGNFDNDAIVVQAKKGSKFSNVAFTKDLEELGTFIAKTNNNSVTLGNNTVKNSKAWLREPILYFKTTVPIDGTTVVANTTQFITVYDATNIPEDNKGTEGENKPVNPEKPIVKYKLGDKFCINKETECFYIYDISNDIVSALAEKNITTDTHIQSDDVQTIAFAAGGYYSPAYWGTNDYGISSKYNKEKPPYVYDENSYIYNHLESYKEYLNGLGFNILKSRLISFNELNKIGCIDKNCSNSIYSSWLINKGYWTGSASNYVEVFYVNSNGTITDYYGQSWQSGYFSIRPVIELNIKELNKLSY